RAQQHLQAGDAVGRQGQQPVAGPAQPVLGGRGRGGQRGGVQQYPFGVAGRSGGGDDQRRRVGGGEVGLGRAQRVAGAQLAGEVAGAGICSRQRQQRGSGTGQGPGQIG